MIEILKGISSSQFLSNKSLIHSLDPRTKILSLVFLIVATFFVNELWGYLWIFSYLIALIVLAKIPFTYMLKWIRSIWFLIFIGAFFQLFTNQGKVVFEIGSFMITDNGIWMAIYISVRLVIVILLAAVLTLTTSPISLTNGLEKLLNMFFIPPRISHEFSMTIAIALRFIPTISEEAERIIKAQMARGVKFEEKSLVKKIRSLLSIIIPLLLSSLRRAEELAIAMEARCYKGYKGRTKYRELRYQKLDFWFYFVSFFVATLSILS